MANPLPIKTSQLFIGLAVVMGLGTVVLFTTLLGSQSKAPKVEKTKIVTQPVVVPISPILQGDVIHGGDVKVVAWPADYLPEGHTFDSVNAVAERVAKEDLVPGEPIYAESVATPGSASGMPAVIPPGQRAVTVAVSEVKGVAGFVKPGDRVDLLVTFNMSQEEGKHRITKRLTKTVLQNLLVLASAQTMKSNDDMDNIETPTGVLKGAVTPVADESSDSSGKTKGRAKAVAEKVDPKKQELEEKKLEKDMQKDRERREKARRDAEKEAKMVSSVTLAVTPEQAQVVAMAEDSGEIRLVLRPNDDNTVVDVTTTTQDQVLSTPEFAKPVETPPPMAAPPPVFDASKSVEVIQGTTKSTVQF